VIHQRSNSGVSALNFVEIRDGLSFSSFRASACGPNTSLPSSARQPESPGCPSSIAATSGTYGRFTSARISRGSFFSWFFLPWSGCGASTSIHRSLRDASISFDDTAFSPEEFSATAHTRLFAPHLDAAAWPLVALLLTAVFLVLGSHVHRPQVAGFILGGRRRRSLSVTKFRSGPSLSISLAAVHALLQHGEYGCTDRMRRPRHR